MTLIWGNGASGRQTVTSHAHRFAAASPSRLTFTAKAGAADGVFEITGTGSGTFYIGTVSLMSADNVQGFRPDTIALLHEVLHGRSGVCRAATSCLTGTGTTQWATVTSVRPF